MNIDRRNATLLISSALLAPFASRAFAQGAPAPEPGVFKISMQPWIGYAMWYVAQERGIFERNGLQVEFVNYVEDSANLAILASGELQGTNVATHNALQHLATSTDLRIVMLEDNSTTADAVIAGPSITSVEDLRGKRVAFEEGSTSHLLIAAALESRGMTLADVTTVNIPASQAIAAMLSGSVDAAVTYEPYLSAATEANPDYRLIYTANENSGLISDVFMVPAKTIQERPGQLSAMIKSWDEAVAEYEKDPSGCQAIMARGVGANPSELETTFAGVHYYNLAENKKALGGTFSEVTLPMVNAVAVELELITETYKADEVVDASFVENL